MKNKMTELVSNRLACKGHITSIPTTEADIAIRSRATRLYERLALGEDTAELQGLSDTEATVEAITFLLYKALNG